MKQLLLIFLSIFIFSLHAKSQILVTELIDKQSKENITLEVLFIGHFSIDSTKIKYHTIEELEFGAIIIDSLKLGNNHIKVNSPFYEDFDTIIKLEQDTNFLQINLTYVPDSSFIINWFYYDKEHAKIDIENNEIKLILPGGFVSPIPMKNEEEIESKYNFRYLRPGCDITLFQKSKEYNRIIAQYLDAKYGTEWRKYIRKDVVGL